MDEFEPFFIGVVTGVFIVFILFVAFAAPIKISQASGDEVCHKLTNNDASYASVSYEKLVCNLPSYDHSSQIIIKTNAEDNR